MLVEVFRCQDGGCHMQWPPTSPTLIPIFGIWSALATRTVSKLSPSFKLSSALPTQSWQKAQSLILKEAAQQTPPAVRGPASLHFPPLHLPKAKFFTCSNSWHLLPGVSLYHDLLLLSLSFRFLKLLLTGDHTGDIPGLPHVCSGHCCFFFFRHLPFFFWK